MDSYVAIHFTDFKEISWIRQTGVQFGVLHVLTETSRNTSRKFKGLFCAQTDSNVDSFILRQLKQFGFRMADKIFDQSSLKNNQSEYCTRLYPAPSGCNIN
jgi:hypothetical protein